METASPNPFVQNGKDTIFRGGVTNGVDDDDFGPETDVDMVDDVLLSPAIAAAKALVAGCHEVDDLERQRQQLADFDDPADMDPNRDTPTPPAHEVATNANADHLAESGGEESEEEWNYIPGQDTTTAAVTQEQADMSSQLNPNAAEFVPESPTRLLMMDDAIISASPRIGFEKSLDNIEVPSENDFNDEISHRPADLGITNGLKSKPGDDYFMRDNFSTLRNKSPDFNSTSTCAQLGDDSIFSLPSSVNTSTAFPTEDVPFDKLNSEQSNAESKDFGSDNDFSDNAFGVTNMFTKQNPMTSSIIEDRDATSSPEPDDNLVSGTPKSTNVEVPVLPMNEDVSPLNHQVNLDSPTKDYQTDFIMSEGGPEDPFGSGQERSSSSGFESENVMEDVESNIAQDSNEGFITEHRKSPPIDLSFKPIQTFSDLNPFGPLQTPSSTTPLDATEINAQKSNEENEIHSETPMKSEVRQEDEFSFLQNTPSSFISARQKTPLAEKPVPFDELESPTDIPQFEPLPNANSSVLASELQKSPEPHFNSFEEIKSLKTEDLDSEIETQESKDHQSADFFEEEKRPKYEETSFTTEIGSNEETPISHVDLDTTAGFLIEESKIIQEEEFKQSGETLSDSIDIDMSNLDDENQIVSSEIPTESARDPHDIDDSYVKESTQDFDSDPKAPELKAEPHTEVKDSDFDSETKEMNLEFESHIASQKSISDSLGNFDDGFEVISREELITDDNSLTNEHFKKEIELNVLDQHFLETPLSQQDENLPINDMNPLVTNGHETGVCFMNAFDKITSQEEENLDSKEESPQCTSTIIEPQVEKVESYQLLTPADEPICTKTESFLTETEKPKDNEIQPELTIDYIQPDEVVKQPEVELEPAKMSETKNEGNIVLETAAVETPNEPSLTNAVPALIKSEPVKSHVITETLITALEETSQVPVSAATEVPSTAGTPPPTPVPAHETDNKDDSDKTLLVAAVAAAAGAVAVGATLTKSKKESTIASKKPSSAISKKAGDTTTKAPTKTAPTKALAAKPTSAKTLTSTTKPASATTKTVVSAAKPVTTTASKAAAPPATKKLVASAKPASAKLTAAPPVKQTAAAKPTSAPPLKSTTTDAPKAVPKHLPVNKTSTTFKLNSKPTTPTSKPTTPTAPKSPSVLKSDIIKSPPKPSTKSSLTPSRPSSAAKSPVDDAEKKTMTNGEVKPASKKPADAATKKPTTTSKTLAGSRPSAPVSKTVPTAKPTPAGTKSLASKPASTVRAKMQPATTTTTTTKTTVPAPIKRPISADKMGKESLNKKISNTKPGVDGKVPPKTAIGAKKTDVKLNGTSQSKKLEEIKAENEDIKLVQEGNVTTTNGYGGHDLQENESVLTPTTIEPVN